MHILKVNFEPSSNSLFISHIPYIIILHNSFCPCTPPLVLSLSFVIIDRQEFHRNRSINEKTLTLKTKARRSTIDRSAYESININLIFVYVLPPPFFFFLASQQVCSFEYKKEKNESITLIIVSYKNNYNIYLYKYNLEADLTRKREILE